MCAATCFHPDAATQPNSFKQFLDPITTDRLTPQGRLFRAIHAVQLRYIFAKSTPTQSLMADPSFQTGFVELQFGTNMPSRGRDRVRPNALCRQQAAMIASVFFSRATCYAKSNG